MITILAEETGQGMVEYSLVGLLSVAIALMLLSVFSNTLFTGISVWAAHAMLTEAPLSFTHGVADVLDLLSF